MRTASNTLKCLLLSACLLPPAAALAGAPLKINFQGRLSESGQPAEGTKAFVFKIYDVASGGTAVWTGASQSVSLSQGVFSTELSAGTPGLSTATFAGARYVEIIVDGVTLSPRQEVVSAPYALVAQALAADAQLPAAAIGAGSVTDYHVTLTTAAITSGRFSDDRVLITTGAFAALNGADQLVKLDGSGYLPALNGSALTSVVAASYSGTVAASKLTGVINDNRLAISSGAFPGGFNGIDQLVKLDGSGRLGVGGAANSRLEVAGSVALPIKTVTFPDSPYTVTENDSTILVNASGGDVTVNLPSAVGIAGRIYAFKRVDDPISGRLVSISASGAQTIDGSSSWPLNSFQWEVVIMQSSGSDWMLLSS